MRIKATIAKASPLPAGAIDALAGELPCRIQYAFPDNEGHISVRYVVADNLSVIGTTKEDKQYTSEIFQETWESVGDWFVSEQYAVVFVFTGSLRLFYFTYKS